MVPSCLLVSNAEFGGAECVGEERERGGRERWDMEREGGRERERERERERKRKRERESNACEQCTEKEIAG